MELNSLRSTRALFCNGWDGNDVTSIISPVNPPKIELKPLRGLNIVARLDLQSTRGGDPSNTFGTLSNSYFLILSMKLMKEVSMGVESRIDDLIEAGWYVLESDFDLNALSNWRKEAFNCVTVLMGPEHTYTQYFKDFMKETAKGGVLAGEGILNAVREHLGKPAGSQPSN
jgi:hypothetical protein